MSKNKWKQVSGDMTWEKHGLVLARDDGNYVEVVNIDSWANMDSSAIPTHGLYNRQEGSVDYEDLNEGILPGALSKEIKERLRYVGMSEEDYAKLEPIHKGTVYFAGGGWDSDESSNNLLELLPAPPEEIEFWGGKETTEKVRGYSQKERQEAVRDHFESRLTAGEWPDDETFDFAFGDEDFEMQLSENDSAAFDYAMLMAGLKKFHSPDLSIDKDDFQKVVMACWEAPKGEELTKNTLAKAANMLGLENEEDDLAREQATELAEGAQSLASSMMETLGIEWI